MFQVGAVSGKGARPNSGGATLNHPRLQPGAHEGCPRFAQFVPAEKVLPYLFGLRCDSKPGPAADVPSSLLTVDDDGHPHFPVATRSLPGDCHQAAPAPCEVPSDET